MIDPKTHRDIQLVASMSVGARRAMGKDEATIRSEALAIASRAVAKNCPDAWDQESMYDAIEKAVDQALAESR